MILSAPFDGYVGITDYKVGDKLKNGDLLLTLDDMSMMRAYLYLPEKILPQIKGPIKYTAYSKLFPGSLTQEKLQISTKELTEILEH